MEVKLKKCDACKIEATCLCYKCMFYGCSNAIFSKVTKAEFNVVL